MRLISTIRTEVTSRALQTLALAGICATAGCAHNAPPDLPGVGNFHKVDANVYRGAQPSDEGLRNLAKLGIRTVVDLRQIDDRSIQEEKVVTAAGMQYVKVPMRTGETPSNENVHRVLELLNDPSVGPVFVHCMKGEDRTGGIIACYRIQHDHWKNDRALSEARSLGMSWFQWSIQRYVLGYHPAAPVLSAGSNQ